ncbi:MAG: polyphosphate kinase 1 [Oscillospiraceae bacterium]|nr:polyphosphate kinase 1 [Oscillospiraceae bacterium]
MELEFKKPYLDNRELSWLKFNKRVLEEAGNLSVPLFERLKFVYIFSNNLDEFFMIRVGYLRERRKLKKDATDNKTNLTASEQLKLISKSVKELVPIRDKAYKEIGKQLNQFGLVKVNYTERLSAQDEKYLESYFKKEVFPLLTPSVIDKKHPVPFLRNREIYVAAGLKSGDSQKQAIGILPATTPGVFNRIVWLPPLDGRVRFMLIEHLIMRYIHTVFGNYEITDRSIFRLTRNADITVDEALFDHDLDFRGVMEELLKKRRKSAPVRIEFDSSDKENHMNIVKQLNLDLGEDYIYTQSAPLDMQFVFGLEAQIKNHFPNETLELFFPPLTPQNSPAVNEKKSIMQQVSENDILLTFPYESVKPFIRLLEEAADDPDVHSIKITLYRLASDSKIINALIRAAENGKYVLALLELRARFDEENNINWSKRLEEAGAEVIYGLEDLKVHSKLLLITKRTGTAENSSICYFTQIGTGNYNEKTNRLYTDLTLLTANKDIGTDASVVFNTLSRGETVESTNLLWVAPRCLKSRVVEMIDIEITRGNHGYIGLKLNSLTDRDIIEKLVEASRNGVTVELLIRGICCLIAGVEGYTDNVRVHSIVGRFLEHSRIYIFGKGEKARVYISSADFMTRNTERRVEVAAPIRDVALKNHIIDDFNTMMNDNIKSRIQNPNGKYTIVKRGDNAMLDSQIYFYERAYMSVRSDRNEPENIKKEWAIIRFFKSIFKK